MAELLTAAQMRAIEQAAIESGEVAGLELMERAGRGVVEAIFEEWPELAQTAHRAVVLCGPGNNGGDGFVVARLLKAWGWEVEVFLFGDPSKLPPDARENYERWGEMGEVEPLSDRTFEQDGFLTEADVVVDAFFGTGLSRAVDLPLCALPCMPEVGQSHRLVAVDVPSGLCADSGRAIGPESGSLNADLTVTFHQAKRGHHLAEGAMASGKLITKDIGLDGSADVPPGAQVGLVAPDIYALSKGKRAHKFTHGHTLILSGPSGKTGAARLAARGALRIGAGLVTVGCPPEAVTECAAQLTAIMLEPVADATALAENLKDLRINALCLGPGLGLDDRATELVAVALGVLGEGQPPTAAPERATVLDADALTILSREPELFAALHDNCILTPHAGEFARLFPDIAETLNAPAYKGPTYSKVDASREAASRAGCVVLFKGPDTVIAAPDGRCTINSALYERSAPWLATAGSGDVLAGFITGLLARGFAPMQAAETAAWLHVECALKFGPGLIAEDLPEQIPTVFRDLGT